LTASQQNDAFIPGELKDMGREPESSKTAKTQIILDPGSHLGTRDLAEMTEGS
jgi:hypothetical protein